MFNSNQNYRVLSKLSRNEPFGGTVQTLKLASRWTTFPQGNTQIFEKDVPFLSLCSKALGDLSSAISPRPHNLPSALKPDTR